MWVVDCSIPKVLEAAGSLTAVGHTFHPRVVLEAGCTTRRMLGLEVAVAIAFRRGIARGLKDTGGIYQTLASQAEAGSVVLSPRGKSMEVAHLTWGMEESHTC